MNIPHHYITRAVTSFRLMRQYGFHVDETVERPKLDLEDLDNLFCNYINERIEETFDSATKTLDWDTVLQTHNDFIDDFVLFSFPSPEMVADSENHD
eukprot:UN02577